MDELREEDSADATELTVEPQFQVAVATKELFIVAFAWPLSLAGEQRSPVEIVTVPVPGLAGMFFSDPLTVTDPVEVVALAADVMELTQPRLL